jgi:hypothetical protein
MKSMNLPCAKGCLIADYSIAAPRGGGGAKDDFLDIDGRSVYDCADYEALPKELRHKFEQTCNRVATGGLNPIGCSGDK